VGLLRDDAVKASRAAAVLEALSHPVRLQLVALLCQEEAGAGALAERLGLPVQTVTWHLRVLAEERLVGPVEGPGRPRYRVVDPVLHGLVACTEEWTR
jgi:DNA-binding transcriptional ArsR family regulator